ncbi:MAG: hypothetical protein A3I66_11615 [Burkholderiales bacterium RIFCSPLOWO2_02_FULL_57_36]|nr:MAG: hypothetical protein A3I66_11615 [Burkholderiales bacterium RIFCSPLOWO2_02_FULL_57_36]
MEKTETYSASVGKRVHRYLFDQNTARASTRDFVSFLSGRLPATVVFGGMIRDLGLGSARDFNSDIDLVSMADKADILAAIRIHNPEINKFGGFRFIVGRQLFDIWSFRDTWAFKEGLVKAETLKDLCATTFFNLDAAYQPLKSSYVVGAANYVEALNRRILDINLEHNPAPEKAAWRAIRMAIGHDLAISSRLQEYILKSAATTLWASGPTRAFLDLAAKHLESGANEPFRFEPQPNLL